MDDETPTTDKADPNVSVSASADGRETIYVRAPVLPAVKREIVRAGFRILSADFAPRGMIIYSGQTGEPEGDQDTDEDEDAEAEAEAEPAPKPKAKPRAKKA